MIMKFESSYFTAYCKTDTVNAVGTSITCISETRDILAFFFIKVNF